MRIFVDNPNATLVCFGEDQFAVKGQVADVPDEVGASVLAFDGYEQYTGQVELHADFVKADKAAEKAAKDAEKQQGQAGTDGGTPTV